MCVCMDILTKPTQEPGIKGMVQYIDTAIILDAAILLPPHDDIDTGSRRPILRGLRATSGGLRATPSGGISITPAWIQISHCPICGEKIEGSPTQSWTVKGEGDEDTLSQ